jgi:general stress protein 26
MDKTSKVKDILSKIMYATVATVSREGQPWNAPVYTAYDEQYNFYWASWPETQHSKNIAENPNVFIVIFDSTAKEGTGEGVYIQAKVEMLKNTEDITHAAKFFYERKGKQPRAAEEFLDASLRRMYKAVPQKVWTNGYDRDKHIDFREEITLL